MQHIVVSDSTWQCKSVFIYKESLPLVYYKTSFHWC